MAKTYKRIATALTLLTELAALLITPILGAQGINRPSLDLPATPQLESSLESFYERERDAQLKLFDSGKAGDWKDLLPTLGMSYTVSNDPRPSLSWSPLSILNRKDAKRKDELNREAIIMSYELIITDHLYKLNQLITDYYIDLDLLTSKESALMIDELLYDIIEERYAEKLLKPSEYLQEKKKIMLARTDVDAYRKELQKRRSEVIYVAKWSE